MKRLLLPLYFNYETKQLIANGFGPAYYVMPEAGRAGDDGLGDALSAADLQGHDGAARGARQAGGRRALTEVEAARADRYSA